MKESELFPPVKKLFESLGYRVNAEVKDCDMTAVKDDELIVIELKKNLSVILLAQALDRQKTGANVFVAIPKPKRYSPKTFRDSLYVLKKLELGLIFVNMLGEDSYAEIVLEPTEFVPVRQNRKKRKSILDEINGRLAEDTNSGGVHGTRIATAFTQKCVQIACVLDSKGAMKPKQLRSYGIDYDCRGLLYRNNYGWFDRLGNGIYALNEKGRREMEDYPELVSYYRKLMADNITNNKE